MVITQVSSCQMPFCMLIFFTDLLPFYAILRSIPNKLLGVIAMFLAILILLAMPFTDLSRSRGIQFRPLSKIAFFIFLGNFLILMQLGAKHVESPYIEFGQLSTVVYFSYFLIIVPVLSLFENSLLELASFENNVFYFSKKKKPLNNVYSNHIDYTMLDMYVKKVFINKITLLLYILYFILFSVFIPMLLIVLTDYYYINSPYSLFGVDYADNKYTNWLMADLQNEREAVLKEYKYYTQNISDCSNRIKFAKGMHLVFTELPPRGFNPPGLDKSIQVFADKWAAFQREYDAWNKLMVKSEKKLFMLDEMISDKSRGFRPISKPC